MSLFTGLQYGEKLGGIVAMSGYLPAVSKITFNEIQKSTPIRLYHGDQDPLLPLSYLEDAQKHLKGKL